MEQETGEPLDEDIAYSHCWIRQFDARPLLIGDTCYYTTGCKRGKAYAVVTAHAKISFVGGVTSLVEGAKNQGL